MAKNVSLDQLLKTEVITRVISRIKTPMSRLQRFFGMQIGGPNVNPVGDLTTGWDIYDTIRTLAQGRAPATGPVNVAPNPVGHQVAAMFRTHEKVLLEEAKLFRTRPLGGGWGAIDARGQRYVTAQEGTLAQRFANTREFMVSRMLRGQFYARYDGDNMILTDSSTNAMKVNYGLPDGNKSQLNINGNGNAISATWATAGTDIFGDLLTINAEFEQAHGWPLRHVWCNSTIWNYVVNNTGIKALAGTANSPFRVFVPTGLTNQEGIEDTGFTGVLNAIPWLTWHVYDGGLDVDGAFTKFFDDTHAVFLTDPDPRIFEYHEGSEIVATNVLDPGQERVGFSTWVTRVIDPAGFELKALDIGLPIVYVPKAIAYGTVAGF